MFPLILRVVNREVGGIIISIKDCQYKGGTSQLIVFASAAWWKACFRLTASLHEIGRELLSQFRNQLLGRYVVVDLLAVEAVRFDCDDYDRLLPSALAGQKGQVEDRHFWRVRLSLDDFLGNFVVLVMFLP